MSEQECYDKTGGPAFPQEVTVARAWAVFENAKKPLSDQDYIALIESLQVGMTMRDYFAAKAMQGIAARGVENKGDVLKFIADDAYRLADAMLKAREA